MNIDELWDKYSTKKTFSGSRIYWQTMDKESFTQAIAEIISLPVEAQVILPCPFCANEKIRTWKTEDDYWHIQCDSNVCGALMDDFDSEEKAIKQWNVRSK